MKGPPRHPPQPLRLHHFMRNAAIALPIIAGALFLGVLGYHFFGQLGWLDSLLNASMILTGMGPVDPMNTVAGKLFASGYALFSGIAFLSSVGVLIAPLLHRFVHRHHLESEDPGTDSAPSTKRRRE